MAGIRLAVFATALLLAWFSSPISLALAQGGCTLVGMGCNPNTCPNGACGDGYFEDMCNGVLTTTTDVCACYLVIQ